MKKYIHSFFVLGWLSAMLLSTNAVAGKYTVTVSNFQFSPVNLNVNVGDTIKWIWSSGSHTTTSNPGGIPQGAASWDAPITSSVTTFEYKVTVAGSYAYVCTPHAPTMAGTFTAAVPPTLSVTPSNRSVLASAGTTTFTVSCNSAWTSSSNASWCSVTASGTGNGTITANYSANTTFFQRVATVTIVVTGLPIQTVTVTQAASTVGVNERLLSDLRVYPNPTKGVFKVQSGNMQDQVLEVSLMDISGKQILSRICSGADEYSFDISQEHKGIYFIRIHSENTSIVRRIVLID